MTIPRAVPEPEFTVEPYLSGVRVDTFLSRHLRNYTRWRLHRMLTAGLVRVNDLPADAQQRVRRGQTVRIRLVEPPDKLLLPEACDIPVLYEDPWLLVVNKPAGLVAHPVGEFQDGTLTNLLQDHLDQQSVQKGLLRAGIVHRLDRMTSGLMVVSKEHHGHRLISEDFQAGRLFKSYLALVEGQVSFEHCVIDRPIGQHPDGRSVLMSCDDEARRARAAKTEVRTLDRRRGLSLVECRLYTGRNHQIRVHMASVGHPVLGDEFYGSFGEIRSRAREDGGLSTEQRHALHAAGLSFRHPILQQWLQFQSAPPADFLTAACLQERGMG